MNFLKHNHALQLVALISLAVKQEPYEYSKTQIIWKEQKITLDKDSNIVAETKLKRKKLNALRNVASNMKHDFVYTPNSDYNFYVSDHPDCKNADYDGSCQVAEDYGEYVDGDDAEEANAACTCEHDDYCDDISPRDCFNIEVDRNYRVEDEEWAEYCAKRLLFDYNIVGSLAKQIVTLIRTSGQMPKSKPNYYTLFLYLDSIIQHCLDESIFVIENDELALRKANCAKKLAKFINTHAYDPKHLCAKLIGQNWEDMAITLLVQKLNVAFEIVPLLESIADTLFAWPCTDGEYESTAKFLICFLANFARCSDLQLERDDFVILLESLVATKFEENFHEQS